MIGIWGPPGIGKTTIARFLHYQISSRFQLDAIMVNIKVNYPRPCLDEFGANVQLQQQMLSQMINQKEIIVPNFELVLNRLKDKKVLLVLDDVDRIEQLDALAKEIGWFGCGSRIIITTEDLSVLEAHRIYHIYKVKNPSIQEAFQIFCMYAFGKEYPDDGFYELAREVTYLAGELPLGLKVLGSALRGKSKQQWRRTLPVLKTRLNGKIESIIKFSYDALSDEEKDLFLYITCILYSFKTAYEVEELLAKKFSNVRQSLHVLVEKSFISIDDYGFIEMHTLLKQFGRETSRKQYVHGIAKRQLLVDARDICDDTVDCSKFIGIMLYFYKSDEELNISETAVERMSYVQFISIFDHSDGVVACERLESVLYHSQKIRYLLWYGFQKRCLPSTFNPEYLVKLLMCGSKLQKLWEGNKPLKNLKWMNLSDSYALKELPDLSTATNLRELDVRNCKSLVELPSTIGSATNLKNLDIRDCLSLKKLPSFIGDIITCLEDFNLSYCESLVKLPSSIGSATNLQKLDISGCLSLKKLPSSIRDITCLRELKLSNCSSLVKLPSSIGSATNLQKLNISGCSSLVKLPSTIGSATNLQKLDISYCSSLKKLPSSIGDIICLREFKLSYTKVSVLPQLSDSLTHITAENCESLERLDCSFNNLEICLIFTNCFKLNQKARDLIMNTSTHGYAVLPGTQVPTCFNYRATGGGPLTIKLNETAHPTSLRFKACITLVKDGYEYWMDIIINIMVKNKRLRIRGPRTEHIYTFEVEVSEVTSNELVFEFETDSSEWKVGECGLLQIM